jgi:peptidoglycan/xylan/chitin deacetylase (PgdA/CDA1 family)
MRLRNKLPTLLVIGCGLWGALLFAGPNWESALRRMPPEAVVQAFYAAIKDQRCEDALCIRPGYSLERCRRLQGVDFIKVRPLAQMANRVAVELELAYRTAEGPARFEGYLVLDREGSDYWIIQEGYLSKDKISRKDFLQQQGLIGVVLKQENVVQDQAPAKKSYSFALKSQPISKTQKQEAVIEDIPVTPTQRLQNFGSEAILAACWSARELAGDPEDRKIQSNRERPDHSPPSRQLPLHRPEPLPPGWRGSIRRVRLHDPQRKAVALTFDLCERASETAGYDAELVNTLRRFGVKATFYAGGKWMRSHPDKTQQLMADPLFEIGNHAWTHGNLRVLKGREMQEQVLWTQAEYERLRDDLRQRLPQCGLASAEIDRVPVLPLSFRYPYGTCSQEALDFIGDHGLPSVQWDVVTADPVRKQSAEAINKIIFKHLKPGSIIIAHANGRGWNTAEALQQLLPGLLQRGYEFVTVSELLSLGEPEVAESCYELKPGDNIFYDRKVGRGTE